MSTEPARIIPFEPPEPEQKKRLYILKPTRKPKGRLWLRMPGKKPKPDSGHSAASWLYRRHVLPHHPKDPHKSHLGKFLSVSIPILIEVMCPDAVFAVAMMFYHRHKAVWSESADKFRAKVAKAISESLTGAIFALPRQVRELYHSLTKPHHKHALIICWSLARYDQGRFFLASRDLTRRLFMRDKNDGKRCLLKLEKAGLLEKTGSGINAFEAAAKGVPRYAASFKIAPDFMRFVPQYQR